MLDSRWFYHYGIHGFSRVCCCLLSVSCKSDIAVFVIHRCAAVDVIMMDSNVTITCLECGKENTSKGFCYGQPKDVWCRRCHSKLTVSAEQCKFVQHQTRELLQTAHAAPKHAKLKRKELVLKQGTPLPDYGTCQHYKKSHRWLRWVSRGGYACRILWYLWCFKWWCI